MPLLDSIDKKILNYLHEQDWPATTETTAKELKISWNTAQTHLYKLTAERTIRGRKVRRLNQWIITEKGKKEIS
jgi:DNA-binding Lrp family transcriptional regulator